MNFFLLGGDDNIKSFVFNDLEPIAPLDQKLTADHVSTLLIRDKTERFDIRLNWNVEGRCFVYPVKTVSQSESGYDLIYQGTSVIPNWQLKLNPGEESTIALTLQVETHAG